MLRSLAPLLSTTIAVGALLLASTARANDDCPAGSVHKTEDGFSWCQPTICQNDGQCTANEVCRPIPLCMEVGELADAGSKSDAGKRLVVTQRCAPDKTCPQRQTCSDLGRCISKATAEKMGILTVAPAASALTNSEPAKKSCGCHAVGSESNAGHTGALGLGVALAALLASRRRRAL